MTNCCFSTVEGGLVAALMNLTISLSGAQMSHGLHPSISRQVYALSLPLIIFSNMNLQQIVVFQMNADMQYTILIM